MSDDMAAQLAAALDGREITDDQGEVTEERETFVDDQASSEQETLEEDSAQEATPESDSQEDTQSLQDDDDNTLAEDDSGKKYVPEKRFKSVYAQKKELERQLEAERQEKQRLLNGADVLNQFAKPKGKAESSNVKVDKADILELKMTLPQFDPNKPDYDRSLDTMAFQILRANPGISPLEAGQRAIGLARDLTSRVSQAKTEARTVKAQQSDSGITTRVHSRTSSTPNPDTMTDVELEAWLKANGQW